MVSKAVEVQIQTLKQELEDEELTMKGFLKNFKKVIIPHLFPNEYKKLVDLDADLMEEEITEKGYMVKSKRLLDCFWERLNSNENVDGNEVNADQQVNGHECVENGDHKEMNGCNGHSEPKDVEMEVSPGNGDEMDTDASVIKETSDDDSKPDKKQSANKVASKGRKKKADYLSQPSIKGMFSASTSPVKRSSDVTKSCTVDVVRVEIDEDVPEGKRIKVDEESNIKSESDEEKVEITSNAMEQEKPRKTFEKCKICRQLLNEDLLLYQGHPENSVDESVALTDPKLSLFTGDEENITDGDEISTAKLTGFSVYDREGHLVPFDGDAIERDEFIYVSGYFRAVWDDNPAIDGAVPVKDIGPINSWSVCGFDGGEKALIMFSTSFGEYYLLEPSEAYSTYMNNVLDKCHMIKVIIELLSDNPDAEYEDLINKLQITVPPHGITCLSEETLLRHAQFLCDQVHSYDEAKTNEDHMLMPTPCMMTLKNLSGVTLSKRKSRTRVNIQKKMPKFTKATTTPLVRTLFENFFADQLDESSVIIQAPKKTRCNVCEVCLRDDCGKCISCKDMIKFGGSGKSKQCCVLRKCPNLALAEALDDLEEDLEDKMNTIHLDQKPKIVHKTRVSKKASVSWASETLKSEGSRKYYSAVRLEINGSESVINVGDCVSVESAVSGSDNYVARVTAFWETKKQQRVFHADWFCRGSDSIIGETADPQELFLMDDCEDTAIDTIVRKENVVEILPPSDWFELGGITDVSRLNPFPPEDTESFFYQKWYCPEFARFEDIPQELSDDDTTDHRQCQSCLRRRADDLFKSVQFGPINEESSKGRATTYKSVSFRGYEYNVGDCVFVESDAIEYTKFEKDAKATDSRKKVADEKLYPEYYRKTSQNVKGSNLDTPDPFRIARILKISSTASKNDAEPNEVKIVAAKFYRPENTHKGKNAGHQSDFNFLFWSDKEATLSFENVTGKCWVICKENLRESVEDFTKGGPYRFYFDQSYDEDKKEFLEVPSAALIYGGVGKGKGKGKSKSKGADVSKKMAMDSYPEVSRKLRCLDVFSGCGGLSEGMHEAGIADSRWAVELFEPAANAFSLNHQSATVFTDDCNLLLAAVMEGEKKDSKGQLLPQKGEVELLCGGPPCQGFSGMNRFNSRQYSQFKNSLVSSYLSYCDYYRPKFFLLENVRNFISYKCSMVLKLTLRVLLKMGYQCTVGVLQAGNFGVPQTRRRAIILAAAPGEILPNYPEPLTSFSPRACSLVIGVDDKKYNTNCQWQSAGPYRTVTVRDALSDLPEIPNGANKLIIDYNTEPESHFQKLIRGDKFQPLLRDHMCKDMAALVVERMRHVPTAPGSDWRDLPNISVKLKSNEHTKPLMYTHHDEKNGRSSTGSLRGVCSCVNRKKPCDPTDKQFSTLIPWCLPHTGNRHNHWAGLYGRLEWNGFFSTTVTNPEPMGKQGRVLHPEQHRVVSVRECARSQGFPDTYRFFGSILEKHRQVGNAVPPPLAKAIGLEILKSVHSKEQKSPPSVVQKKEEEEPQVTTQESSSSSSSQSEGASSSSSSKNENKMDVE